MTPRQIPSEMLYINGIEIMQMYAGIASVQSLKFNLRTEESIIKPTIINAGAVANDGIAKKIGDSNKESKNKNPVVIDVNPVLPPAETPDELSTKVVVVDVPKQAPAIVATESARSAPLILGNLPSLSNMLALDETPIRVPRVSNISTNKNENIIIIKSNEIIFDHSNLQNVGAILGIDSPFEKSGNSEYIPNSAFGT